VGGGRFRRETQTAISSRADVELSCVLHHCLVSTGQRAWLWELCNRRIDTTGLVDIHWLTVVIPGVGCDLEMYKLSNPRFPSTSHVIFFLYRPFGIFLRFDEERSKPRSCYYLTSVLPNVLNIRYTFLTLSVKLNLFIPSSHFIERYILSKWTIRK
jgi:hypothetical protein